MSLATAIQRVTELADAIDDYWWKGVRKTHPNYPLIYPGDTEAPPPPEVEELRLYLTALPDDELFALVGIVQVGRLKCKPTEYAAVGRGFGRVEAVEWLVDSSFLGADIDDGLNRLGRAGIDARGTQLAAS
jgi:hypothetical protein